MIARIIDNTNYPRFANPHTQRLSYVLGANQYAVLRDDITNFNIRVYKSANLGFDSVEMDAVNAPLCPGSFGVAWSGTTLHVVYQAQATNLLTHIPFDLVTETWGVPNASAVSVGLGAHPIRVGVRSTGELVIFYGRFGPPPPATEVWYILLAGGVWSAEVQVSDTPGEPPGSTKYANGLFVDASDVAHFFYAPSTVFFGNIFQYHRGLSAANVLDGRQDIFSVPAADTNGPILGVPIVHGGILCVPYNFYAGLGPIWNAAIFYGTTSNMTSPVWTNEIIDATEPVDNTGLVGGNTATFAHINPAGDLMVWWMTNYLPYGTNKLLYSTRVAGVWSAPPNPYYRLGVDPNPGPTVANQFLHDMSINNQAGGGFAVLVSAEAGLNPGTGFPYCTSFWLLLDPPAPTPAVQIQHAGFRRMVVLVPNKYDLALGQELKAHLRARPQRQCYEPLVYHDLGVIRAPKNFIPFRKTAGIPTPLAASGDVEVVNFRVPAGYDGVIAGLFHYYTGPGFADGNGDIQWRLAINKVYAIHLGNVLVQLGSVQQAFPVDGGIFIQSGNIIRYIVNVPNLSGGILPLATQIVCGLEGLFYARS